MRFEVPQFIEVEDKIFGPLTWKQFIYVAGTGGVLVVFYLFLPLILFIPIGLAVGVLGGGLAFYPVNNRPMSIFLEAVLKYFSRTKLYLWNKVPKKIDPVKAEESTRSIYKPPVTGNSITTLSRKLELNALQRK